jgi:hypothetical protein
MFEQIVNLILNLFAVVKSTTNELTNTLVKKYPDKTFKAFWLYNYYSVIINDFFDRYNIRIHKSTKFSLPIEETYYANCIYYKIPGSYHLYFESCVGKFTPNSLIKEGLGVINLYKTPDYTLCNLKQQNIEEIPAKSSAKFINVIFSNNLTKKPLTLKLDQSYFYVGNEILSSTHVFLLLSILYESSEFVFDDSYELKIMDSKFNLRILKSDQWITIDDSNLGYHISWKD